MWDLASMNALRSISTPHDYALTLALSPDGKTLVTAMEHEITSAEDKRLLKVGWRKEDVLRLWDVDTGEEKGQLGKGTHSWHLTYSPDGGRLASVQIYTDGIRIWEAKTGAVNIDLKHGPGTRVGQSVACFSPDGKLLASGGWDAVVWLWDTHSGKPIRPLRGHQEAIRTVVFSPEGTTLLSGGDDDTLRLWDVATGKLLHELVGHHAAVTAAAFSPDGKRIASASEDTTLLIWDVPALSRLVRPPPTPLSEEELQCLWTDLGSEWDAVRQRSIRRVMTAPKATVGFLRQRLKPDLPREDRLARLLADLDSDSFAVRESASRELASKGKSVEPLLRRVLGEVLSPEKRRRVQELLEAFPRTPRPFRGMTEQERRLVHVAIMLDRIGTPDALDLLQYLAHAPELPAILDNRSLWDRDVHEVKAVLARLANRPAKP